jgi:hypothetical protein
MQFFDVDTIPGRFRLVFMIIYDWALVTLQMAYLRASPSEQFIRNPVYEQIRLLMPFQISATEIECTLMLVSIMATLYKYYNTTKYRENIKNAIRDIFPLFLIVLGGSVLYNWSYGMGEDGKMRPFLALGHYQFARMVFCFMIIYGGLCSSYTITSGWRKEANKKN